MALESIGQPDTIVYQRLDLGCLFGFTTTRFFDPSTLHRRSHGFLRASATPKQEEATSRTQGGNILVHE